MIETKNPHDRFFKETMTRRQNAVSFFREYLPQDVVAQIDWRTLTLAKDSFVDPELRERFSDVIYDVRIKGQQVFIYLLLEHQSSPDAFMPWRMLGYITRLWELYLKQNPDADKLPGVIGIVFYHGNKKWNADVQFQKIVKAADIIPNYIPSFEYVLADFSEFSDAEIKGDIVVKLFLSIMNKIFSPDIKNELERLIPLFIELSEKKTGMEYILTVLRYVYHVSDAFDRKEFETKLTQAIDDEKKGDVMTIAEQLRMEGEIKGRIEGRIEGEIKGEIKGKIETFKELMNSGFLKKDFAEKKIAELMKELNQILSPKENIQAN